MKLPIRFLTLTTALLLFAAPAFADINVTDVRSYETSEGMKNGAVLLTLENTGKDADKLISATSPVATEVEIHEMSETNGVMKMREVGAVTIEPHNIVSFKPDGYHIMLMGLKAPLKAGEAHPIVLKFLKAGDVRTTFEVQPRSAKKKVLMDENHADHSDHTGH